VTRGAIRDAAAERFFRRGYEATTVREIADDLEIRAASIYYHYADKEQILYELVASTMTLLRDGVAAAVAAEPGPAERLAAIAVHHTALHALRPREATLGDTELRSLHGDRLARAVALRDSYEAIVRGVLADGLARGAFSLVEPTLTAFAVIAMCTNVGIWYRPGGRLALAEVADAYAQLALRLAGGPSADPHTIERALASARRAYTTEREA
jgi:AcrR family transcriptional regulator